MHNRDKSNKKLVELLWIEINRAIIDSSHVRETLSNLKKLNMLDDIKEYNLVLDINKLIEMTSMAANDNNDNNKDMENAVYREVVDYNDNPDLVELKDQTEFPQEAITSEDRRKPRQYIDGKPMSENQILFQEYQSQGFDEEAFLKKSRVRF